MQIIQRYKFSALLPLNGIIPYGGYYANPETQPRIAFIGSPGDKPRMSPRPANSDKPKVADSRQ